MRADFSLDDATAVVATVGTTGTTSVDPVPALLDLVVQRLGNVDRIAGHRCTLLASWLGRTTLLARTGIAPGGTTLLAAHLPPLLSSRPAPGLSSPVDASWLSLPR
jgi:hypothetical protein